MNTGEKEAYLNTLLQEFQHLDGNEATETVFIIFPDHFADFTAYLAMATIAERFLAKKKYEGIYQLASFHPQYLFAGSSPDDAANYTNRSPYPMLQILRETSISKALKHYANPENIPETNIDFARQKGLEYMRLLREGCIE